MVDTARSRNFVTSFASMLVLELKHTQCVGIELLLRTRNCVKSTRDFKGYVMYLFLESTCRRTRRDPKTIAQNTKTQGKICVTQEVLGRLTRVRI